MVERANGFLETSFLPGRTFVSPHDFNAQLTGWLPLANQRAVRSIAARPVDLLEADYLDMTPLPPAEPPIGLNSRVRLARDYYVRVDSVDPRTIGWFVHYAGVFTLTGDSYRTRQRRELLNKGRTTQD